MSKQKTRNIMSSTMNSQQKSDALSRLMGEYAETVQPLRLEDILKQLEYCGIHYDAELAAEGQGWESAAEPEPQYFETLSEALQFQYSLRDSPTLIEVESAGRSRSEEK